MINIDINHLKSVLDYNPDSGLFTWKVNRGPVKVGDIAGGNTHGYVMIRYNMVKYLAHRLAWFYLFEEWPEEELDHINGNKLDNRINNLRESSKTENAYNRPKIVNKHKFRGVCTSGKLYIATIKDNGKTKYLGSYATAVEAAKVYEDYASTLQQEFYCPPKYLELLIDVVPCRVIQSNITGFTGVSISGSKYRSQIKVKGAKVHLGTFNSAEEAYEAYLDKKEELGRGLNGY